MVADKPHNVENNPPMSADFKLLNEIIIQILAAHEAFQFLKCQPANPNNQKRFIESIKKPHKKVEQIKNPANEFQRIQNFFNMIQDDLQNIPESLQEIQDCFTELDDFITEHMEILNKYTNNRASKFGIFSIHRIEVTDNDDDLTPPKFRK